MMIKIEDNKDCCGCTACASICPHNAISMLPDIMGFLYPVVDKASCVECGLCEKICQFHDKYNRYDNYDTPEVFGCRHKNTEELSHSQSGAAAWAITQTFLQQPGVVYGVGYESVAHIVHKRATTLEECQEFRGSKYVQSDLRGVFRQVKDDLNAGHRVLFFGTGCQVSGLKSFTPKTLHEKLYTVDLVCHATPSPAVWESYLHYHEAKRGCRIVKANFRDKRFGWHSHREVLTFEDGSEFDGEFFFQIFYKHLIIRDSCSACHYTNFKRVSDVTIADFWGWEKAHQEWNDNKGVSLLLVNSEKGEEIKKALELTMHFIKSDTSQCLQPQLQHPVELPLEFNKVKQIVEKGGYKGVAREVGYIPGPQYYKDKYKSLVYKVRVILSRIKHSIV